MTKCNVGSLTSDEPGSTARSNLGKPDYSLIPLSTLAEEALVWEYGAKKYARFNWTKGSKWSIALASALRHLAAWQDGAQNDDESGHSHLAHAICNLRMLTLWEKTYPEGDDRFKPK